MSTIRPVAEQLDALLANPTALVSALEVAQGKLWSKLMDGERCTAAAIGVPDDDFEVIVDSLLADGWPIVRDGSTVTLLDTHPAVMAWRSAKAWEREIEASPELQQERREALEKRLTHGGTHLDFAWPVKH